MLPGSKVRFVTPKFPGPVVTVLYLGEIGSTTKLGFDPFVDWF